MTAVLSKVHRERHTSGRASWLRASVLGANDAIVSTSSLMIGVAASEAARQTILVAGLAGLVAGALSMAVGEYVSVSSQRDAEQADIEREKRELASAPGAELRELVQIYVQRGLDEELAQRVAQQLSEKDRLGAHLRDELGIDHDALARPWQAAWISATSFAASAAIPVLALIAAPASARMLAIVVVSLLCLCVLGALGAHLGGAAKGKAAVRVVVGGALAMAISAGVGRLVGVAV
ncbi:MAG TPA: VIT family protein [Polyangiaceae bacterium]